MGNLSTEAYQNAGTKTVSMFSKLLSHSSKFVMEGVKNLVPKKHNLPLAKVRFVVDFSEAICSSLSNFAIVFFELNFQFLSNEHN